jgi:type I restriction enzyme S subunit
MPPSWSSVPFGSIFTQGKRKNSRLQRDFVLSVIKDRGVIPYTEKGNVGNKVSDDLSGYKLVDKGDFVLNSMNLYMGSVGVSDYDGVTSTAYIVCKPSENVYARYYNYLIQCKGFQEYVGLLGKGIMEIREAVRWTALKSVSVPLPDLATQRQIADFLDRETARIDLLIEKKQRLVALLGEKYEATAAQLSTGQRSQEDKFDSGIDWLGAISKSWSVEKLSWHFYAAKGKDAQKYTKEYCGANEGEYPVYSGQTANEGVMGRIDTFDYDFGETGVLFATTVGAKAMDLRHLQGKFSLSQNCMIIIPRQQIPLKFYLYQMRLLFRKERQLIPDHMQASFRVEDLYRYRIAVPPMDHAFEIGAKIEKAEAELKAVVEPVNASIDRLKEYRSALITAAVTGQIDVSTYAKSGTPDRRLDAIQEEMGA